MINNCLGSASFTDTEKQVHNNIMILYSPAVLDSNYTLCPKKVPTFKLSETSPNLKRFSQFLHCWKAYKISYKTHVTCPSHHRRVATLPWEIKNSYFLHTCRVCWVYLCANRITFIKILSLSLNTMLIVDKHCSDVCCDEFPVPQIDHKSN